MVIENDQNACHPRNSPYFWRKGVIVLVIKIIIQVDHVVQVPDSSY